MFQEAEEEDDEGEGVGRQQEIGEKRVEYISKGGREGARVNTVGN